MKAPLNSPNEAADRFRAELESRTDMCHVLVLLAGVLDRAFSDEAERPRVATRLLVGRPSPKRVADLLDAGVCP